MEKYIKLNDIYDELSKSLIKDGLKPIGNEPWITSEIKEDDIIDFKTEKHTDENGNPIIFVNFKIED